MRCTLHTCAVLSRRKCRRRQRQQVQKWGGRTRTLRRRILHRTEIITRKDSHHLLHHERAGDMGEHCGECWVVLAASWQQHLVDRLIAPFVMLAACWQQHLVLFEAYGLDVRWWRCDAHTNTLDLSCVTKIRFFFPRGKKQNFLVSGRRMVMICVTRLVKTCLFLERHVYC